MTLSLDVEHAVNNRYSLAAHQREAQLCCPIEYDSKFLDVIPKEIEEKTTIAGSDGDRHSHAANGRLRVCPQAVDELIGTIFVQRHWPANLMSGSSLV